MFKFKIAVSDIAALCGRHQYKSAAAAKIKYLQKRHPKMLLAMQRALPQVQLMPDKHERLRNPVVKAALSRPNVSAKDLDALLVTALKGKCHFCGEEVNSCHVCAKGFKPEPKPESKSKPEPKSKPESKSKPKPYPAPKKLPKMFRSIAQSPPPRSTARSRMARTINMYRGRARENDVYTSFEKSTGLKFKFRQQQCSGEFKTATGNWYEIVGKADGVDENGVVVEIKNRMRRFFEPQYDVDQLCCYAVLLGRDARLVQNLNGELRVGSPIPLSTMRERWAVDIKPKLDAFVDELKEAYLTTCDVVV